MRKRDRIFIAPLLAVSLLFAAAPTALAAESGEQFVFDKADLLTTEEEDELNDMANNLAENFNMNFVILTTDDAEGKEAEVYADDFYMDNGFYDDGKDGGAIYIIDMDNRQVQVETSGIFQLFQDPDVVSEKLSHFVAAGDPGKDSLGVGVTENVEPEVRGNDRGFPSRQPLIDAEEKLG